MRIHCSTIVLSPSAPNASAASSTPLSDPCWRARKSASQYVSCARASDALAKPGIAAIRRAAAATSTSPRHPGVASAAA
ncbi:MAG: hypothetical protein AUH99_02055 [Candidatus Rokubacteria bacterium 13_2_20CM_2_70_11]|nr:MAG: hypothetical protein AUH99_02055 [Candidatus Rokubacteria bacterium 13_2_20CM_2_70_11]